MSGKRPTDHLEPSAKKRGSERQLTKDDGSEDEEQAVDPGQFARASEDVIKQRKIIKARRGGEAGGAAKANPFAGIQLAAGGSAAAAPAAAANPFAGVSLFGGAGTPAPTPSKAEPAAPAEAGEAPAATAAEQVQQAAQEAQPEKEAAEGKEAAAEQKADAAAPASAADKPAGGGGFGALGGGSGGGLAFGKSGFGAASGGFGSLAGSTGGAFTFGASSAPATGGSSIFSFSAPASAPAFSFTASSSAAAGSGNATGGTAGAAAPAAAAAGGTSLFGATPASGTPLFGAAPAAPAKVELPEEAAVTTGEEGERTVFSGEGALFEFDASKQWRERGRGEMRINLAPSGQARMVMRQKGNLRLLLNANLWADMPVSRMEGGKGATFAVINAAAAGDDAAAASKQDGGAGSAAEAAEAGGAAAAAHLSTYAFRIKSPEVLDQFVAVMNAHKAGGGSSKNAAGQGVPEAAA